MRVVAYRGEHVRALGCLGGQDWLAPYMDRFRPEELERAGPAFTGMADGRPIGSAGLVAVNDYRAIAWAVFAPRSGRFFTSVVRAIGSFLDHGHSFARVEAYVDYSFSEGHRLARLLGFAREVDRARYFLPDGRDASVYVRYRGDD